MDGSGIPQCSCDPGYHDDGIGGCTTDVCVPFPCAVDQACRVDSEGAAECYTPVCNDLNPCTTDTFEDGGCVYTDVPNGTGCTPDICITGQTCTDGVCGGGMAVVCSDGNPCTRDTCSHPAGCDFANDDSLRDRFLDAPAAKGGKTAEVFTWV